MSPDFIPCPLDIPAKVVQVDYCSGSLHDSLAPGPILRYTEFMGKGENNESIGT
jgi:hypothetical protein